MTRLNFIFIFISSSDPNLLQKKIGKTKNKKMMALWWLYLLVMPIKDAATYKGV